MTESEGSQDSPYFSLISTNYSALLSEASVFKIQHRVKAAQRGPGMWLKWNSQVAVKLHMKYKIITAAVTIV